MMNKNLMAVCFVGLFMLCSIGLASAHWWDPFHWFHDEPPVDNQTIGNMNTIVGYSIYNDTVYIWNNINNYFFNKSSGIQMTNHYEDYWSRNIFCLGYYNNEEWNKIKCADELENFNKDIITDNETYVNATLWKDIYYNGYDIRFGVQYHLGVNDNSLSITTYMKNIGGDIPYNLGFAWKITDWEIPPNSGEDYLTINNTDYLLNGTYDLLFKNMTVSHNNWTVNETTGELINNGLFVEPIPTLKGYDDNYYLKIDWNENLDYSVKMFGNGIQEDFYVALLIDAGHFNPQQEKSTTFQWIDADYYYFDASDSGPTDPDSVWSDQFGGNAFDGDTGTFDYSYTATQGTDSSNEYWGGGTTAPSSGEEISQVRARTYGGFNSGGLEYKGAIYTSGKSELLGVVARYSDNTTDNVFGDFVTLDVPSGGWTWEKVQALEIYYYRTDSSVGSIRVHRGEVEVTVMESTYTNLAFIPPTRDSGNVTSDISIDINVSINYTILDEVIWSWNRTNYTIFNDSLVLMYNFDNVSALGECTNRNETSCIVDISGHGNNGTLGNGTSDTDPDWTSDGRYGGAFDFNKTQQDRVSVSNADGQFNFGSGDYSIEMWIFNHYIAAAWEGIMGTYNGSTDGFIFASNWGNLAFFDTSWKYSGVSAGFGRWSHIVYTRQGTNGSFYINGTYVSSVIASDITNGNNLHIGTGGTAWVTNGFDGKIDEPRIYNRTLSATEINQMYMSNLNKYEEDKWLFYVNETNITFDTYYYETFASNSVGWNSTGERNITFERVLSLDITDPTTESPVDVTSGDNISIVFDFQENGVNITEDVTLNSITIDGTVPIILQRESTEQSPFPIFYENFESGWVNGTSCGTGDISQIGNFNNANNNGGDYAWCASSTQAYEGTRSLGLNDWDDGQELRTADGIWYNFDASTACDGGECKNITVSITAMEVGMDASEYCWITQQVDGGSASTLITLAQPIDSFTNFSANLSESALSSDDVDIRIMCKMSSLADITYIDNFNITGYDTTFSDQFEYIAGTGWEVNVTVPTLTIGLKDLFLNATYDSITRNDTQENAVNYESLNDDWGQKLKITINHSLIDEDLVDFPFLLTNENFPERMWNNGSSAPVLSDGCDIRFTLDENGTNQVPFELVNWTQDNSTGSEIWVKLDISSTVDTDFYVWWNNSAAECYAVDATYGAQNVWTNDYVTVHHFSGSNYTDLNDSTSYGNDISSATGSPLYNQDCKIGKCVYLDGGTDVLTMLDSSDHDFGTGEFTIKMWGYYDGVQEDFAGWYTTKSYLQDDGYHLFARNITNNIWTAGTIDNIVSNIALTNDVWRMYDTTRINNNISTFVNSNYDNSLDASGDNIDGTSGDDFILGRIFSASSGYEVKGYLDEFRIRKGTGSSDGWLETEYNNQEDPGSFTSYVDDIVINITSSRFYATSTITIEYTVTNQTTIGDKCWYSDDLGVTNSTPVIFGESFPEFSAEIGYTPLTIYCNNTDSEVSSASEIFYVANFQKSQKIIINGSSTQNITNYTFPIIVSPYKNPIKTGSWTINGKNYRFRLEIPTKNVANETLTNYPMMVEINTEWLLDNDYYAVGASGNESEFAFDSDTDGLLYWYSKSGLDNDRNLFWPIINMSIDETKILYYYFDPDITEESDNINGTTEEDNVTANQRIIPEQAFPQLTDVNVYLNDEAENFPYDISFSNFDGTKEYTYYDIFETKRTAKNVAMTFLVKVTDTIPIGETFDIKINYGDENVTDYLYEYNESVNLFYEDFENGLDTFTNISGSWTTNDQQIPWSKGGPHSWSRAPVAINVNGTIHVYDTPGLDWNPLRVGNMNYGFWQAPWRVASKEISDFNWIFDKATLWNDRSEWVRSSLPVNFTEIYPLSVQTADNITYWMSYVGATAQNSSNRIGLASSTDLINWENYQGNYIWQEGDQGSSYSPTGGMDGYLMWDGDNDRWVLYLDYVGTYNTSVAYLNGSDPTAGNFTYVGECFTPVDYFYEEAISVIKEGSTYYLFYSYSDFASDYRTQRVGYATSDNAFGPFTPYNVTQLINMNGYEWDAGLQGMPKFYKDDDGVWNMVYAGEADSISFVSYDNQLGRAIATDFPSTWEALDVYPHAYGSNESGTSLLIKDDINYSNVLIQSPILIGYGNQTIGNKTAGMVFRYQDESNYYYSIFNKTDDLIQLYKVVSDVTTLLNSSDLGFDIHSGKRGSAYTMRIGLYEGNIKIWTSRYGDDFDLLINITDTSLSNNGSVGLIGVDSALWANNFFINDYIDPQPSLIVANPLDPPTFSSNSVNNTEIGKSTEFGLLVDSGIALEPNGEYIFSTNNSGTWVNDSNVSFTETPEWANATKILNTTVGISIGYKWFLTDNLGNYVETPIYTLTTTDGTAPVITNIVLANDTGIVNGTVTQGDNFTINATVTDVDEVDKVWVIFWKGIIGGPILAVEWLANTIGDIWEVEVETNSTWDAGDTNYTVYANDTSGNEINQSSNFTILTSIDTSFTVTLPDGTTEAIYSPSNSTAKNVSAINQTDSIPFFNVTNIGNTNLSFNLSINASLPTGIVLKGDTDNNPAGATNINTSNVSIFTGLTSGSSFSIWYWSDFTNAVEQNTSRQLNMTTMEE